MNHEIKIIMKYKDGEPIKSCNTIISLDDEPIGCIQNFKLNADAGEYFPELEFTFPDLKSDEIDLSYKKSPNLIETVDYYLNKLKIVPNIKLILKKIF